jgi:RNA ligase
MDFQTFPKIPRLKLCAEVVITEKLDGTNAQIVIKRLDELDQTFSAEWELSTNEEFAMFAGSRTRWIKPGAKTDNYGFAAWVKENAEELFKLGEGQHFGEWYGQGIQRNYGLDTRRFALFNRARYESALDVSCVEFVPLLYTGGIENVDKCLQNLRERGSYAVPGFMNPEGIIVYNTAARSMFKVLLENDNQPKGQQ